MKNDEYISDEYISNSIEMARHLAYLCEQYKYKYNNTKIQKLLFICYGVVLAREQKKLVDESPQVWPYGPVFPVVFKYINNMNNTKYSTEGKGLSKAVKLLLKEAVKVFGKYRANALSAWSHKENSPWAVVHGVTGKWETIIPDEIIKPYFKDYVLKKS